jgi:hypothetical protein
LFSVDATVLRVDDIYQRETQNRVILQNLDWRLQRLEDLNINMFDMLQKMYSEGQDYPYEFHRPSAWCTEDIQDRQEQERRRRSSIIDYELNTFHEFSLPKSRSTLTHRLSIPKPDQIPSRKKF